jgi:NADH dehydrogenase FAD-containing subunit
MSDKRPHILIIGGGSADYSLPSTLSGAGRVTLINDEDHFLFKPMLMSI